MRRAAQGMAGAWFVLLGILPVLRGDNYYASASGFLPGKLRQAGNGRPAQFNYARAYDYVRADHMATRSPDRGGPSVRRPDAPMAAYGGSLSTQANHGSNQRLGSYGSYGTTGYGYVGGTPQGLRGPQTNTRLAQLRSGMPQVRSSAGQSLVASSMGWPMAKPRNPLVDTSRPGLVRPSRGSGSTGPAMLGASRLSGGASARADIASVAGIGNRGPLTSPLAQPIPTVVPSKSGLPQAAAAVPQAAARDGQADGYDYEDYYYDDGGDGYDYAGDGSYSREQIVVSDTTQAGGVMPMRNTPTQRPSKSGGSQARPRGHTLVSRPVGTPGMATSSSKLRPLDKELLTYVMVSGQQVPVYLATSNLKSFRHHHRPEYSAKDRAAQSWWLKNDAKTIRPPTLNGPPSGPGKIDAPCQASTDCRGGLLCPHGQCACPIMPVLSSHTSVGCDSSNVRAVDVHGWCMRPLVALHGVKENARHTVMNARFHHDLPDMADWSRCAVVGSSSVLTKGNARHGKAIDSHTAVIRMNAAPTKGYEEFVGTKTTLRVQNVVYCGFHESPDELLLHYTPKSQCAQYTLDMSDEFYQYEMHYFDHKDMHNHQDEAKVTRYKKMSAGFMAIALAVHLCAEVDVYGMRSADDHYYAHTKSRKRFDRRHDWDAERACLDTLARGRLQGVAVY